MEYQIKTLPGFAGFDPTNLKLHIGDKFNKLITVEDEVEEVPYVCVTAILTQTKSKGQIQETFTDAFPFSYWSTLVEGYDPETKQPILNKQGLNFILAQFNIEVI